MRHHVAAGQIGQDRARRQQPRIDDEIAELVLAEVDQPVRRDRQRARLQRHPRRRLALVERRDDVDHHPARGQPLDRAGHVQPGMRQPADREGAVRRAEIEIGEALPAERRQPLAASTPSSRHCRRRGSSSGAFDPAHRRRRRRRPARRATTLIVSLLSSGTASSVSAQFVAAGDAGAAQRIGIGDELRAPRGDVRGAVDPDEMRLPGHFLRQHQPVDLQPVDVDIDVGQHRRVGVARFQLHRPSHRDERRLHRIARRYGSRRTGTGASRSPPTARSGRRSWCR